MNVLKYIICFFKGHEYEYFGSQKEMGRHRIAQNSRFKWARRYHYYKCERCGHFYSRKNKIKEVK